MKGVVISVVLALRDFKGENYGIMAISIRSRDSGNHNRNSGYDCTKSISN